MRISALGLGALCTATGASFSKDHSLHTFTKTRLSEKFWCDAAKPWKFHPIAPNKKAQQFTHGLGVGDVNDVGRIDLWEKDGWWEQPPSPAGDPLWTLHEFAFNSNPHGGAMMYAYDVNGEKGTF